MKQFNGHIFSLIISRFLKFQQVLTLHLLLLHILPFNWEESTQNYTCIIYPISIGNCEDLEY